MSAGPEVKEEDAPEDDFGSTEFLPDEEDGVMDAYDREQWYQNRRNSNE